MQKSKEIETEGKKPAPRESTHGCAKNFNSNHARRTFFVVPTRVLLPYSSSFFLPQNVLCHQFHADGFFSASANSAARSSSAWQIRAWNRFESVLGAERLLLTLK